MRPGFFRPPALEVCPRCGGAMRIIGFVTEHAVVTRILAHLERRGVEARGEAGGLPGDEGRAGDGRRGGRKRLGGGREGARFAWRERECLSMRERKPS